MPPLMVRVGISDQPGDTRHCMYLSRTYSCQARFLTARFSHSLVLCLSGPTPSAMVKQLKQWTHINETARIQTALGEPARIQTALGEPAPEPGGAKTTSLTKVRPRCRKR